MQVRAGSCSQRFQGGSPRALQLLGLLHPVSASIFTWAPSPWVSGSEFLFFMRTFSHWVGATLLQCDLIRIISAKTLLPNKVMFTGTRGWDSNTFSGDAVLPPTDAHSRAGSELSSSGDSSDPSILRFSCESSSPHVEPRGPCVQPGLGCRRRPWSGWCPEPSRAGLPRTLACISTWTGTRPPGPPSVDEAGLLSLAPPDLERTPWTTPGLGGPWLPRESLSQITGLSRLGNS